MIRGTSGNLHFRANFDSRAVKFRDFFELWAAIMVWTMWEMVRAQLVLDVITVDLLPFSLLPLLLVLLVLGLFFFLGLLCILTWCRCTMTAGLFSASPSGLIFLYQLCICSLVSISGTNHCFVTNFGNGLICVLWILLGVHCLFASAKDRWGLRWLAQFFIFVHHLGTIGMPVGWLWRAQH